MPSPTVDYLLGTPLMHTHKVADITDYAATSPGGTTGQVQYNNAGAFGGAAGVVYATSGTHLAITAQAATDKPVVIKGATSQSANLQEWQNSSGTALAWVNPIDKFVAKNSSDSNSEYFLRGYRADGASVFSIKYAGGVGSIDYNGQEWQYNHGGTGQTTFVGNLAVDNFRRRGDGTGAQLNIGFTGFNGKLFTFTTGDPVSNTSLVIADNPGIQIPFTAKSVASYTGPAYLATLISSTGTQRSAWDTTVTWVVATDASRTARVVNNIFDTATREYMRAEASGSAAMIGFLGANAAIRQTSGADLTNNVTAGGTNDIIANYTDLSVYANDAAAIRNNIYQLSRKLKQVNDALRLYGLLT